MEIEIAASDAIPTATYAGLDFYKIANTGNTWTPSSSDDEYKFSKAGLPILAAQIRTATLTFSKPLAKPIVLDDAIFIVKYDGTLLAYKPVGSVPNPCGA